jgi:DNA polymerase-3 subunit delta'
MSQAIPSLLPWHRTTFQRWHEQTHRSHAYLIVSPEDTGSESLLHSFAASVLCETPTSTFEACGHCAGCLLIQASSHPDYRVLRPTIWDVANEIEETRPEKPSKHITIDQVRDLSSMVNQTSHRGGQRAVLIYPAHTLNANAANALLKTLEEPPANTVFFLLAHDIKQLLPTIISRCQRLAAPAPELANAIDYLNTNITHQDNWADKLHAENGAVMRVANLNTSNYFTLQEQFASELAKGAQSNALKLAEQFDKHIKDAAKAQLSGEPRSIDMGVVITWLQRWTHDLSCAAQQAGEARYFKQHATTLKRLSEQSNPDKLIAKLHHWHQQLLKEQRAAEHPLNTRTWLEKLFLQYTQLF